MVLAHAMLMIIGRALNMLKSQLAAQGVSPTIAHNIAHGGVSCGPESSLADSRSEDDETKKAQETPGFIALCQLLSSTRFSLRMGDIGLEYLSVSQGKRG